MSDEDIAQVLKSDMLHRHVVVGGHLYMNS